jgi:hypothetical protein
MLKDWIALHCSHYSIHDSFKEVGLVHDLAAERAGTKYQAQFAIIFFATCTMDHILAAGTSYDKIGLSSHEEIFT